MPHILVRNDESVKSVDVSSLLEGIGEEQIVPVEDFPISPSLKAIKRIGTSSEYRVCLEVMDFKSDLNISGTVGRSAVAQVKKELKHSLTQLNLDRSVLTRLVDIISGQLETIRTHIVDGVYFYCTIRELNNGFLSPSQDGTSLSYVFKPNLEVGSKGLYISPNVYGNGKLCLGSNSNLLSNERFKTLNDLSQIYLHFLASQFNTDLHDTGHSDSTNKRVIQNILQEACKQEHPMAEVAQLLLENHPKLSNNAYVLIYLCNIFNVPTSTMGKAFE